MPTELAQKTTPIIESLENLRHDIRSSLIGILGLAEALQTQLKNTPIAIQSKALTSAISACLDFQTSVLDEIIENNQLHSTFCIKTLAGKAIDLVKPRALLKNLIVNFHFDDALPAKVNGDAPRLFRIIHELLTNAIKFTDEGSITIHLRMQNEQDQQFILCGEISDTGIGIADHEKEAIFQRFYRISSKQLGSGIGLSQARNTIHELNGWCELQSTVGQGTTVYFYIPLLMSSEHSAVDSDVKTKQFDNIRVLLIEDHPVTATAIQQALLEAGCCVDVAMNGKSALHQLQQKQYDSIVMDLHLPDMSGADLLKQINKINLSTPIIGLTADRKKCEKTAEFSGIQVVLEKPVTPSQLMTMLNNYVNENTNR